MPVRFANSDDVAFQAVASRGDRAEYLAGNARHQGRFYFVTPVFDQVLLPLYDVPQAWLFSLLRTLAFSAQVGLATWLAARVMQSAVFGIMVALMLVGTLHIPPTFFLLLSFPPGWIGFCALLGALHCHYSYLSRPGMLNGLMTGILYLLAALMHEVFVVFLPMFFALSLLQQKSDWRRQLRLNTGPLTVAVGYAAAYLLFAWQFPSAYAGTRFSPDFIAAAKVVLRQLIGVTPGFELFVNRPPAETAGPLFRGSADILATMAAVPWPEILLGLGTAFALILAFNHCLRAAPPRARYWPWALGFACLANLPVAFSVKYQVFIFHREYPYAYAYYSFYLLCVAAGGALVCVGRRVSGGIGRRVLVSGFGLVAIALCYSALASNRRVLQLLLQKYQ